MWQRNPEMCAIWCALQNENISTSGHPHLVLPRPPLTQLQPRSFILIDNLACFDRLVVKMESSGVPLFISK